VVQSFESLPILFIKLSNGQMTACMRKDKTWESIVSTKGFARGINSWECVVDRVTTSSNIFFGVAGKASNVDSYVGCDEISWGWIGCLACWHGGRKVKHPFGERLKTGDVVRVTLDLHRRCMSIALNGVDQGVALDRLPSPLTMEGGKLYPAFSFYNKYDQITLLRGGVAS
jgi:SPRY domain